MTKAVSSAIGGALAANGSSLVAAYKEYATWGYDKTKYADGANYPIVWVDRTGLHSLMVEPKAPTPCAFEWIYFARSDSRLDGIDAHEARIRMGHQLAREHPIDADIVVPVPDSGIGAAIGYAR